jgi:pimeloyl-ACP methyl ester carboxylesterase
LKSSLEQIKQSSLDCNIIQLEDNLVNSQAFNSEMVEASSDLTNFLFSKYEKKLYSNLEKRIPKPKDSTIKYYNSNSNSNSNNNNYIDTLCGEDLGEKLLKEYLLLGDRDFTYKYRDQYINTMSTSEDHKMSLYCLEKKESILWGGSRDHSFFQGEVLSGLINPLMSLGCLSPSLLIHAKSILFNARERIGLEVPLQNRIKNEAIRKDWHKNLALLSSNANNNNIKEKDWKIKYTYFKGYLQREGTMIDESSSSIEKPLIILIHGFGGSLNQMTSLAQNLVEDFDVAAVDMLGFGHAEKPPLSYNQYFWRDQIVAYVKKVSNGRKNKNVFLMGNSIGGFIVTAAAATLSMEYAKNSAGILPTGLVLCNSAGDLASDLASGIVIDDLFKTYEGPSSEFLRVFGKIIFSLLQPLFTLQKILLKYSTKDSADKEFRGNTEQAHKLSK